MKNSNLDQGIKEKIPLFTKNPVIQIKNVSKSYTCGENKVQALYNINLEINHGDFLAIVGQSGSGKSTLMNILGCLDVPTEGEYFLNLKPTSKMKNSELSQIRNTEIGFIFQGFNLIQTLSAIENVELPLIYRKMDKKQRITLAKQALVSVGLESRLKHKPSQMSGGQQQRVAIARAIVGNPSLILADEPTGNLDSNSGKEIINILTNLNQSGKTIILITHDTSIAQAAKRVIRIHDGKIVENF